MRWFLAAALAACLPAGAVKPPARLIFASKTGSVAYDHASHVKRAKGACAACHPKPWPQDAKAAIHSKDCRMCHTPGGAAFEMKGNCQRCHGPGAATAAR